VTALLLLHGFTGAPSSWDAVRALLGDVPTECPWLSGHGTPPAAPEVASFEAEVDRLAALARGPTLVAGYSLGARLALGLLVRHPERFVRGVLVSGSAGLDRAEERAERVHSDERWIALLKNQGLASFVTSWEREPLFGTQTELPAPLREAERARRLAHTAEGLAHSLAATGTGKMPSYWPDLPGLARPVEVVTGALDPRFCAIGRAVVSELVKGTLTVAPGAGHNLLLERPRAVADAILRGL
jgi:2-succinyl-6-hydroxy-2,4-cyclohexadiene-1-carboxylate synthase